MVKLTQILHSTHCDDPAGDVGLVPELDGGHPPLAHAQNARQGVVQQELVAGALHRSLGTCGGS